MIQSSQMHLVFTSLITEKRRNIHKGTEAMHARKRPDIVLSVLKSLNNFNIRTADFYLEFDETSNWASQLIKDEISNMHFNSDIYDFRLDSFDGWRKSAEILNLNDQDLIMLFSNDDHVFIGENPKEFELLCNQLIETNKLGLDSDYYIPLSHYPELHAFMDLSFSLNSAERKLKHSCVPVTTPIGALVLNYRNYKKWWAYDFTNSSKFVGPENPFGPSLILKNSYFIVPRLEMFRHFDSYGHIGLTRKPYQILDPNFKVDGVKQNTSNWSFSYTTRIFDLNSSTLLLESGNSGDIKGFVNSIIKASAKRFSVRSFIHINSLYKLSRFEILVAILYLSRHSIFLVGLSRYIIQLPLLLAVYCYPKIVPLADPHTRADFIRHLSNISSHGFIRYFRILVLQIIRRRYKNFVRKMSK
jgi:hypothetical protein